MPIGTIIAVGASLLGGYLSSKASKKAAKIQAASAREGLAQQREQFERSSADLAPYRETGAGAITTLAQLYGIKTPGNPNAEAFGEAAMEAFRRSPDYKFALDEGSKAAQFSAAAKGSLASGNTLRDLTTFGQGLATQNFQNYANRLLQLAGMGQSAATTGAGLGANFGNAAAAQIGNAGQAQASGVVGSANAWNQALGSIGNNLFLNSLTGGLGNGSGWGSAYNLGGTPSLGLAA